MNTVKYEGNIAPVLEEFKDLNYQSRADGKHYIFDSKAREWVELKDGNTIVDSPDGYYIGDKKGNPSNATAEGPVLASAAESTPEDTAEENTAVTSSDVKGK